MVGYLADLIVKSIMIFVGVGVAIIAIVAAGIAGLFTIGIKG